MIIYIGIQCTSLRENFFSADIKNEINNSMLWLNIALTTV